MIKCQAYHDKLNGKDYIRDLSSSSQPENGAKPNPQPKDCKGKIPNPTPKMNG